MSALMIKDLSVTEQLDSTAMKAVRGGYVVYPYFPTSDILKIDNSKNVTAQQLIQQGMTINNMSDNNDAFNNGLPTKITPTMNASNNVIVS